MEGLIANVLILSLLILICVLISSYKFYARDTKLGAYKKSRQDATTHLINKDMHNEVNIKEYLYPEYKK